LKIFASHGAHDTSGKINTVVNDTGINDTGNKFATGTAGVVDTGGNFATSVNATGSNFVAGVNHDAYN
jgi:hypothetical protein